jgi:hypothetical protein
VHYGALAHYLHRRPVEEVSLARFTRGHPVWVRSGESSRFDCEEVIRRARSRVGEDCYRLLSNNCEHFCEWCLHGQHRSYQVKELIALAQRSKEMTMTYRVLTCLLIALMTAPAFAGEPANNALIPFANLGGIQNWRADGSAALYVQGRNRKWYHAELLGSCPELPFANRVGLVVEPTGEFDRFSSIVVQGHQCMVKSLIESDAPPAKSHS